MNRYAFVTAKHMANEPKNSRDFYKIAAFSTSLAAGVMAAFLGSIKNMAHDPSLEISAWTWIMFVAGAAAGWLFWKIIWWKSRMK